MSLLLSWFATSLAFAAAAALLPGIKIERGVWNHLVVAGLYGTLVFFFGQALYVVIGIGTLGLGFLLRALSRLVAGALLLLLTSKLTRRIQVSGFGAALLCALVVSVLGEAVQYVLSRLPG
jgi:uncharacterized membrane protein YvlD (DUF360 family)